MSAVTLSEKQSDIVAVLLIQGVWDYIYANKSEYEEWLANRGQKCKTENLE